MMTHCIMPSVFKPILLKLPLHHLDDFCSVPFSTRQLWTPFQFIASIWSWIFHRLKSIIGTFPYLFPLVTLSNPLHFQPITYSCTRTASLCWRTHDCLGYGHHWQNREWNLAHNVWGYAKHLQFCVGNVEQDPRRKWGWKGWGFLWILWGWCRHTMSHLVLHLLFLPLRHHMRQLQKEWSKSQTNKSS